MMRLLAVLMVAIVSTAVLSDIAPIEQAQVSPLAKDPILARALREASQGKLQDKNLITELRTRFQKANDARTKIFVANLLSHASVFATDPMPYINYVLSQPESIEVLGANAVLRLHRYRGDEAYESGQFARALDDFRALTATKDPLVRQYAVLKLGWCHMNLEHPEEAWKLWVEEIRSELKKSESPSPNFLHSLGQAFTEKRAWTAEDGALLAGLKLDQEQRQAVQAGFEQGLDVVRSFEVMQALADRTAALSWATELSQFVIQKTAASGKRACEFLPFLRIPENASKVKIAQAESHRLLESCIQWVTKSADKDKSRKPMEDRVAKLLPRLELTGPERRLRILFADFQKDVWTVCREGLTWLNEPFSASNTENARLGVPVKEIAARCATAVRSDESSRNAVAGFYRTAASGKWLRSEKDPLVFVLLATIQENAFGDFFSLQVSTQPSTYAPTLVPALLVERMNTKKNYAAADALFDTFAERQSDSATASPAWREILTRRLTDLLTANQLAEARILLETRLASPSDPTFSQVGVRLWTQYLARARSAQLEKASAAKIAETVLTPERVTGDRKLTPGMIEILGSLELWDRVHAVAASDKKLKVSALASDRLRVDLVAATASGLVNPDSWKDVDDAGLEFLFDVGRSLQTGLGFETIRPVGKSPVASDLSSLQELQRTQSRLLDKKKLGKDPAHKALAWIQHLDRSRKRIRSRSWCHPLFVVAAENSLKDFCRQAEDSIPSLRTALTKSSDSDAKWSQFFSAFEERLEECQAQKVEVAE